MCVCVSRVIPLKKDKSVELSMLDDAFVKICDHVNDSSMPVRALAAQLLGDFTNVSEKFLEQTLDKKLMSHLRIIKSDHQRQLELHQRGGSVDWDSGRSWGMGAPKVSGGGGGGGGGGDSEGGVGNSEGGVGRRVSVGWEKSEVDGCIDVELFCVLQLELDPEGISLMKAGACGAFVHGLEDEFMGK